MNQIVILSGFFRRDFMFLWDAKQYGKYEMERTLPCYDLIQSLPKMNYQSILDIGCGIGNSTLALKKTFPKANIVGADSSVDMLICARKKNPDLNFEQINFSHTCEEIQGSYDLLFSNACIHWINHHEILIPNLFQHVKDGGALAIQIPLQSRHPFYQKINAMVESFRWVNKIKVQKQYYTYEENRYYDILSKISKDFRIWETTYYHSLENHESVIEWYRGSGLRSYLEQLSKEDGRCFENELLQFVKEVYPKQEDGRILFKIPRLFFVVNKSGLK